VRRSKVNESSFDINREPDLGIIGVNSGWEAGETVYP